MGQFCSIYVVHFLWNCCGMGPNNLRSTLVQLFAWCRQATSHYLRHCWPISVSSYDITREWLINTVIRIRMFLSKSHWDVFKLSNKTCGCHFRDQPVLVIHHFICISEKSLWLSWSKFILVAAIFPVAICNYHDTKSFTGFEAVTFSLVEKNIMWPWRNSSYDFKFIVLSSFGSGVYFRTEFLYGIWNN